MKTISKLALTLMLVTLCAAQLKAQKISLKGKGESQVITVINDDLSELTDLTDLLKDDYKDLYNKEIYIKRRGRKSGRNTRFFDARWGIDKYYPRRGTQNFVNVYLGLNNYLQDGDLPNSNSLLSLQPLTSWYLGLNFDNVTHILGPLYLDWGAGVSIQDFSFENTRTRIEKGANSITFTEDATITGRKSKISMSHINLHFVPTISFGRYRAFRIGLGGYAGYRIGAHAKYKFDDAEGDKQKEKIKDNWFINPFRYGVRATVGWDFFDLFFNYDLTELFEDDIAAPKLNPVTFGVIF